MKSYSSIAGATTLRQKLKASMVSSNLNLLVQLEPRSYGPSRSQESGMASQLVEHTPTVSAGNALQVVRPEVPGSSAALQSGIPTSQRFKQTPVWAIGLGSCSSNTGSMFDPSKAGGTPTQRELSRVPPGVVEVLQKPTTLV